MALVNQHAASYRCGEPWPQHIQHAQHMGQEYSIIEAPSYVLYDSRSQPSTIPRALMSSQHIAYNSHSVNTGPAAHYHSQGQYVNAPYPSPPPSITTSSPSKEEFSQRSMVRAMEYGSPVSAIMQPHGTKREYDSSSYNGFSNKRTSSISNGSTAVNSNPVLTSKTVTYNETIDPADQVQFETEVDVLMKVLQEKSTEEKESKIPLTPVSSPKVQTTLGITKSENGAPPTGKDSKPKQSKKHICNGPNCNKAFKQKTHLDIHQRVHTGVRPFVCNFVGCGLTFTQRGNLRTHERRHLNQRPFICPDCSRGFAQRGNLRSHQETHKGLKPYACRLDNCAKTFSQLGNMKTHQNNFHKAKLQELTSMFLTYAQRGEVPEEHRELLEYFQQHYKNSNKGIKGRGKGRVVSKREPRGSHKITKVEAGSAPFPRTPIQTNNFHADMRMAEYSVSPGSDTMINSIPRTHHQHAPCGLFDHAHGHHSSAGMWYEDQTRPMEMPARLY